MVDLLKAADQMSSYISQNVQLFLQCFKGWYTWQTKMKLPHTTAAERIASETAK